MLVIAHRGASAVAPESTRAALEAAITGDADGVELDVQLSRDGRLIIFHDERLDRTTDGAGAVARHTYPDLARLDAGAWFNPRFSGQRILLASQALRLFRSHGLVNLELKPTARGPMLIDRLVRCLQWTGSVRRVLVSSFATMLLERLRRRGPTVARAVICHRHFDRALAAARRLACDAIHPHVDLVTPQRVVRAHADGLRVHVWTVDRIAVARRLAGWGVDGIFSNDPARMTRALR